MTNPYLQLARSLEQLYGISAKLVHSDQLVLPARIWLSFQQGLWYVCTWTPACYQVPSGTDLTVLCHDCLTANDENFYVIPEEIVYRYNLSRISNQEFEEMFPEVDGDDA